MKIEELSLFDIEKTKIIESPVQPHENISANNSPLKPVIDTFNTIQTNKAELQRNHQMRQALGKNIEKLSDDQLETMSLQLEFLVDTWLNEFEKQIFEGKTLKELLKLT